MKQYEIIPYNSLYRDKLYQYLCVIISNKQKEYIEYCIEKSDEDRPSFLVIDDNKNVVGCHLFFSTTAFVKGEEKRIAWGHDTFLNDEYRSSAGLDFVLAISCKNTVGIGLSEINRKIQKKLKKNIQLDTVYNYFLFDIFFPLSVLRRVLRSPLRSLKQMNLVRVDNIEFRLVDNVNELVIPNNGYWFKDQIEYDIIRDANFLEYRFFNNQVFHYSVYEHHDGKGSTCYFVVRPFLYKGLPAVLLVDCRYYGETKLMHSILRAVIKIARYNRLGLIQTTSGLKEVENVFTSFLCMKRQGEALIHKSLNPIPTDYISITPADADVDFNR